MKNISPQHTILYCTAIVIFFLIYHVLHVTPKSKFFNLFLTMFAKFSFTTVLRYSDKKGRCLIFHLVPIFDLCDRITLFLSYHKKFFNIFWLKIILWSFLRNKSSNLNKIWKLIDFVQQKSELNFTFSSTSIFLQWVQIGAFISPAKIDFSVLMKPRTILLSILQSAN